MRIIIIVTLLLWPVFVVGIYAGNECTIDSLRLAVRCWTCDVRPPTYAIAYFSQSAQIGAMTLNNNAQYKYWETRPISPTPPSHVPLPDSDRSACTVLSSPAEVAMVTFYEEIVPELHDFIIRQPVFFTGSAPLHLPNSHVNVSPKGYTDTTFTIVNSKCVWYQDATGSGIETISHIYDNGRVTIMFCSFGPEPLIVRLFGKGTVYEVSYPVSLCRHCFGKIVNK